MAGFIETIVGIVVFDIMFGLPLLLIYLSYLYFIEKTLPAIRSYFLILRTDKDKNLVEEAEERC
jgi:hypothetical protein